MTLSLLHLSRQMWTKVIPFAGMEAPFDTQGDEYSEYGSDFTPDEEGILNELLSKIPDTSKIAHPLVSSNVAGYGRLPDPPNPSILGREKPKCTDSPSHLSLESTDGWTPVQVDCDETLELGAQHYRISSQSWLTDGQEPSREHCKSHPKTTVGFYRPTVGVPNISSRSA